MLVSSVFNIFFSQLSQWSIIQFTLLGDNAEMRVNSGPAVQLAATGLRFVPTLKVNVGGVPLPERMAVSLYIGGHTGFVGALYEVTINREPYLLTETALINDELYINSYSTTLSGIGLFIDGGDSTPFLEINGLPVFM